MEIYVRDDIVSANFGIINLHPSRGTHWVCYIGNYCFDSYGCAPPKIILNYIKSRYGNCVYSEYQIQKNNLCGSYCSYILFCMLLYSMNFKTAVLNLYYNEKLKEKIKLIK